MAKQLAFDSDARNALFRGVDKVARAVRATLGPRGRAVILDSRPGAPTITIDGVTVARAIELADPIENLGAQLLKEVSSKTQDDAGDGTTTAAVLAQAIVVDGLRHVAAGADPMGLKRGIDRAVEAASRHLKSQSRDIRTPAEIAQVARVSANNDAMIGRLIADALGRVGRDGVASIEEARGLATELEVVEGLQFDRGYLSPYFVTDAERLEAVLHDPLVLVYAQKLAGLGDLVPLLERVAETGRQLLVVAEDVSGEALATLVVNALRGRLRAAAVEAPAFGGRRQAVLEDLAVLCGGRVVDESAGRRLRDATPSDLGSARRVVVDKDTTTVIGGGGDAAAIRDRRRQIERQLEAAPSGYERETLEERRARLAGGVAVIRVGAPTEAAMKERKARFEDALAATRAALREGIVPGGGVGLLRAADGLGALEATGDVALGVRIVRRALAEPLRRIAVNSGAEGSVVVETVRHGSGALGFNAWTLAYEDLIEAGIVDPTLVVRTALANAASIGGLLLTTDAAVADRPGPGDHEDGGEGGGR